MSEVESNQFQENHQQRVLRYDNRKEVQQNDHENKIIYVNSSDQFQNMEISRSQQMSRSFKDLEQQQEKLQNKVNEGFKKDQGYNEVQKQKQPAQNTEKENSQNKILQQKPQNKNIQVEKPDKLQNQQNSASDEERQIQTEKEQASQINTQQQQTQTQNIQPHIVFQSTIQPETTQEVEVTNAFQQTQPEILQQSGSIPQKQVNYQGLVSLHIFQKKINQSIEFKNKGNQFFKISNYEDAIKKYSEGLRILDPKQFYGATQAECQKMAQVSASLLFNIGSCFFNMAVWKSAQIYFSQTILINANHIKALYKRALCRYETQNYEGAMNDIKLAFNKDRSNGEIHKSYQKILQRYNEQVKKQKESLKQMSSKIFRKDSQKSLNQSQKSITEQKQEKVETNIQNGQQDENNKPSSDLWGFAPLVLVAGAALYLGYKKWFSK